MKPRLLKKAVKAAAILMVWVCFWAGTTGQAMALGPQPEPPDIVSISKQEVFKERVVRKTSKAGTAKIQPDSVTRMETFSDGLQPQEESVSDAYDITAVHATTMSLVEALAGERRPFDEVVLENLAVEFDHADQVMSLGTAEALVSETDGVVSPTYKAKCVLWNRSLGKSARLVMEIGEYPLNLIVADHLVEAGDVGRTEFELGFDGQECVRCRVRPATPGPVWIPEERVWADDEAMLFMGWNDPAAEFEEDSRVMEIGFEGHRFIELVEEAVRAQSNYGEEISIPGIGSGVVEMAAEPRLERGSKSELVSVNDETAILVFPPQVIVPFAVGSALDIDAVFSLELNPDDTFVIDLEEVRPDPSGFITAFVQTFFQEIPIPLPADSLLSGFGDMPDVIGRGLTISDEEWLTIRFEYARCNPDDLLDGFAGNEASMAHLLEEAQRQCLSASQPAWREFLLGSVRPHADGADWNVYVDGPLLQEVFETTLRDNIEAIPDVALTGRFGSELHPMGDDGLNIAFWMSGDYLVPYCAMSFTANVDIDLFLDGDELAIHGAMPDLDAHPGIHCSSFIESIAGLLFPGFSWAITQGIDGLLDGIIDGYEDEFDVSGGLGSAGMDCTQSDTEFTCTKSIPLTPIELSDTSSALFSVDHLIGDDGGLLLGGGIDIHRVYFMHPIGEFILGLMSNAE